MTRSPHLMGSSNGHQPPMFEQLLAKAREGHSESVGELFESCRGYLLVIANNQLSTSLRAKVGGSDLVQQTLMHAHRDFGQFRGQSQRELLAWLHRILINQGARTRRDYQQTAKRDLSREVPLDSSDASKNGTVATVAAATETPSHYAMAREDQQRLERTLESLDETDGQVIRWRNRDLLTFAEIGSRLQMTGDSARRAWSRAVERLRVALAQRNEQ